MPVKRKHDPGYKLPEMIEPENCCICIPIPNDFNHKMAFLGQLDELGYWWNWERDPAKQGREAAAVWRTIVQCIREELNMSGCGCGDDQITNQRYTEDGHLQVSYDGGETWENADAIDPRFNSPIFAPPSGADGEAKRCAAANSAMVILEQAKADASAALGGASVFANLVAAVVGLLAATGIGVVAGVVVAIMGTILVAIAAAGQATFDASFTSLVWDELFCSLFCHMEDDGSFTEAGWQAVVSEAAAGASYPANEWLSYIIKTMSPVGLTNAARSGYIGTRDCDGCVCDPCFDCTEFAWTGSEVLVTPASANVIWIGGVTLEGSGYLRCDNGEGVEFLFDEPICIDSFRMPCARGVNPTIEAKIVFNDDPVAYTIDPLTGVAYTGTPSIGYVHTLTSPKNVYSIKITCQSNGANPSQFFIHGIELHACAD